MKSSPARERLRVYNKRLGLFVEATVRVTDSGQDAVLRLIRLQDIVDEVANANVTHNLGLALKSIEEAGVHLLTPVKEEDLDLTRTTGLHRLANDIAEVIVDLHEGGDLPGQGLPKLPRIAKLETVSISSSPVAQTDARAVEVEVVL